MERLIIEMDIWWRLPQKIRFLIVGGYNTVFGYAAFAVCFLIVGKRIHYLLVGLLAHLLSVTNAFLVHRSFVFRASGPWQASFVRFNLSQLIGVGFGMGGLYTLVEFGHLNPLIAQAFMIALGTVLAYSLHRTYSFGPEFRG